MQFRFLAWYCWKQGLQVIGMQNASVSIKSTKLNSSKVEASTISSSFTENHVLPNLSNWCFFCVNKFSKEFDFLHVLIYYVIKKQDYAFWHIYNAHEIPWTTYTKHWYPLHIEEMEVWFYYPCLQFNALNFFYKTDIFFYSCLQI